MHVLQYVAVKATDVDDALQNVRTQLEDHDDRWYDWFDEDGGRWASTEKPISHKAQEQEFVEKFAELMNQRSAELRSLTERFADTGYDLQGLISLYDPLEPLTDGRGLALYGLSKIVNLLYSEWDYNSAFYDAHNETATPFELAEFINTCKDTATGAADDDETWWLVPVDFHF